MYIYLKSTYFLIMNSLLDAWYRNHALLYKILLIASATFVVVYLFPISSKFKFTYEKGKPWQSKNLYAPFDFAIKKSDANYNQEVAELKATMPVYFEVDKNLSGNVLDNFQSLFLAQFTDTLNSPNNLLYSKSIDILRNAYQNGIIEPTTDFEPKTQVILLSDNIKTAEISYQDLVTFKTVRQGLESELERAQLTSYQPILFSILFDVIKVNAFYNESLTEKAFEESINRISKYRGSIARGTLIVSKGEIIQDDTFNILRSLEIEYESQTLSANSYWLILIAYTVLVTLTFLMLLLFLRKYRIEIYNHNTKVTFIVFNMLLMVFLTSLVVKFNTDYIYVIPICILPLILKAFFDARLGLFAHVLTVLLLGFIVPNSFEYMFLQIIAGIVTILTVSELYKRTNLFISVGQITFIYLIAYTAFFAIHEGSFTTLNFETLGLFMICGLATLFVQPLIYIYEKMFGLISDVSLLELSDTNSKLLKELSNKAPGTFHHSLNVANLAETCANEIGANAMLVRVGALYHDIGKMINPTYFTENQVTGINPHDDLSPRESARIILNHVINGIEIAKKHNLPDRIIDFIRTHHGTNVVYYFYSKEKETNADVNKSNFRYIGPKPFSKETAILMMCDSVEAASKSLKEPNSNSINDFVETIINTQSSDAQFINADITFRDIETIKKVLKKKLANIFHIRIKYPD